VENNDSFQKPPIKPPTKPPFVGDTNYVRLDNRTKVSLMAAIMFALDGSITEDQAVEYAISLDNKVAERLRQIKHERRMKGFQ
jgi:hypothetical protein